MLDDIEKEIDKISDPNIIILSHFPIDNFWPIKSSRGRTFEQIIDNEHIIAYLCGHFHPSDTEKIHRKYFIEYIGSSAYQFKKSGVITVDNGQMVYNTIDLLSPPEKYFITNPVPSDQISHHQQFSDANGEIRLLSYDKEKDRNFTVSGAAEGIMKYERTLKNGAHLYSFPLNIKEEGIQYLQIL